jgi:hypothetical protein
LIKKIHVYDLDGVLVDTSHRYRNKPDGTIDLDYWCEMRTRENIQKDKILGRAEKYLADCLNPRIYTVICTSRMYHVDDIEFIVGRLGAPDKLLMRPEGNKEGDAILKVRALSRLFNLRQFKELPKFFWEDNIKNIEATRHLFTDCFLIPSTICYKETSE